jgi:hypothetical protein
MPRKRRRGRRRRKKGEYNKRNKCVHETNT